MFIDIRTSLFAIYLFLIGDSIIHYYADIDKTRREVERLIKEGKWDTKEFAEMREKLLKELQIKHDPINNEVVLKKLSVLEGKLEKLEKLEKLLEEIHAK
ncbi:hypothetical protein GLOIN_2v1615060 [Rhizophagus irregularis DAOM 181602=DAOM 197198]|nr:hypothetical protein GLOIN_2v1615060 [Rhizophagus irregularis DAOM 181602=DAOM 197198]